MSAAPPRIPTLALLQALALGALTAPAVVGISLLVNRMVPQTEAPGALSAIITVGGISAMVASPVFGWLVDRSAARRGSAGRRPWLIGGAWAGLAAIAAMLLATGPLWLGAAWGLAQISYNSTFAALNGYVSDRLPARQRTRAAGLFSAASFVGTLPGLAVAALFPTLPGVMFLAVPVLTALVVTAVGSRLGRPGAEPAADPAAEPGADGAGRSGGAGGAGRSGGAGGADGAGVWGVGDIGGAGAAASAAVPVIPAGSPADDPAAPAADNAAAASASAGAGASAGGAGTAAVVVVDDSAEDGRPAGERPATASRNLGFAGVILVRFVVAIELTAGLLFALYVFADRWELDEARAVRLVSLSTFVGAAGIALAALAIAVTRLTRIPPRVLLAAGLVLLAVAMGARGFTTSIPVFVAATGLAGIAIGTAMTATRALTHALFPGSGAATGLGLLGSANTLGASVAPVIANVLLVVGARLDWVDAYAGLYALLIVPVLTCLAILPLLRRSERRSPLLRPCSE